MSFNSSKFYPKSSATLGTDVFFKLKSDQELFRQRFLIIVSDCYFVLMSIISEEVFLPKVVVRC